MHISLRSGTQQSTLPRLYRNGGIRDRDKLRKIADEGCGTSSERNRGQDRRHIGHRTHIANRKKRFEPGVLAQANGNLLYVDEVNLLEDHMVDLLLDAAAMGINYVEREGISFEHPSRFILVGSMNPEEGDLRPQLLDRFGLCVGIKGEKDTAVRTEIVSRRLDFDADPEGFTKSYADATRKIRDDVLEARKNLPNVVASKNLLTMAANVSLHFEMEGHRADITMIRAAKAHAALYGRNDPDKEDLATVAPMVLNHRIKRKPFEDTKFDMGELRKCLLEY